MEAQPPSQQPHILQNSVVVFSKNYLPLARINIKRAIVLLVTGQAESLDFSSTKLWQVCSPSVVLQVPEHIRLTVSNPERHWKVPPVNRREVLRRDNHTCQYCGSTKHLTLDHVIPRSKGGQHTWDNVVTACEKCNSTKSDRLPHEARMVLKTWRCSKCQLQCIHPGDNTSKLSRSQRMALTLTVHHSNFVPEDNRRDNLCALCHSLSPEFSYATQGECIAWAIVFILSGRCVVDLLSFNMIATITPFLSHRMTDGNEL